MFPAIGIYSDSYPDKRLIMNKIPECCYEQVKNQRELSGRVLRKIAKKATFIADTNEFAQWVYFTLDCPKRPDIDIIHSFNRICLFDRNYWVASFEKTLPAYFCADQKVNTHSLRKLFPYLVSDKCIGLLPMSKWALRSEMKLIRQIAKEADAQIIEQKMTVLYPPQNILVDSKTEQRKYGDLGTIRFLYVGTQVKRKGGILLLKVFEKLRKNFHNFHLTFVGDVESERDTPYYLEDEEKEVKRIIENADWVDYYPHLSNNSVLEFAKEAHVGLLPTLCDSFGFSVLEMQACGCPVITTDRQALPEINNIECGWLLDTSTVDLPHGDDFAYYSKEEVALLSEKISVELETNLRTILMNPGQIEEKAILSIKRIEQFHDPSLYANDLLEVYGRLNHNL